MPCFSRHFRPSCRLARPLRLALGPAVLLLLLTLLPTAPAQDAPPPSQRSSPFSRGPAAPSDSGPSATPTPIAQAAVQQAPAVVLPPAAQGSPSPAATAADGELSLEIRNEPDGPYVTFTELLRIVREVHPDARANWDGILGVFRIEAAGHSIQALSERPILVVDGRTLAMTRALRVRDGVALVPAGTVNEIFRALEFDFQLPVADSPARPAPAQPAVAPRDAATAGSPLDSGGSLLSNVAVPAVPPIDLPQLGDSVTGLKWADLTDAAHPREPRRLTLVHDEPLSALAQSVAQLARRGGELQVSLIGVDGRRDDPALVAQIARSQPELLLDFIALPALDDRRFDIWTVHEALWPPRSARTGPEARSIQELFLPHQFHNLALAAMLRSEVARGFPEGIVRLELSPCYLLRRVDAPSAAILIPGKLVANDSREIDRLARAVGAGFLGYAAGLRSARR